MSYDPYQEAQDRYAEEYDRRRDEAKGNLPPNRANHPGRRVDQGFSTTNPTQQGAAAKRGDEYGEGNTLSVRQP